jgi:hypothetical protein
MSVLGESWRRTAWQRLARQCMSGHGFHQHRRHTARFESARCTHGNAGLRVTRLGLGESRPGRSSQGFIRGKVDSPGSAPHGAARLGVAPPDAAGLATARASPRERHTGWFESIARTQGMARMCKATHGVGLAGHGSATQGFYRVTGTAGATVQVRGHALWRGRVRPARVRRGNAGQVKSRDIHSAPGAARHVKAGRVMSGQVKGFHT